METLSTFGKETHSALLTFESGEHARMDVEVNKKETKFWDKLEETLMDRLNRQLQRKVVKVHLMRN